MTPIKVKGKVESVPVYVQVGLFVELFTTLIAVYAL